MTFPGPHGGVWGVDNEGFRCSRAGPASYVSQELPGTHGDRCCASWGTGPCCSLAQGQPGWPRVGHSSCWEGQAGGAGLCGPERGSGAQLCPSMALPKVSLAATSSPTRADVLVCEMQAMPLLTPEPDGSSILSCFLKEVALRQSHRLLSCPLDVPLQQILSLLAKFNHRRAGVWKIKATSECHSNLPVGCGGVCVWAMCSRPQSQPWHHLCPALRSTREVTQGTSVVGEVLQDLGHLPQESRPL